jgi:hypothetical protein
MLKKLDVCDDHVRRLVWTKVWGKEFHVVLGGSVAFRGERDVFLSGKLGEGEEEEEETD